MNVPGARARAEPVFLSGGKEQYMSSLASWLINGTIGVAAFYVNLRWFCWSLFHGTPLNTQCMHWSRLASLVIGNK